MSFDNIDSKNLRDVVAALNPPAATYFKKVVSLGSAGTPASLYGPQTGKYIHIGTLLVANTTDSPAVVTLYESATMDTGLTLECIKFQVLGNTSEIIQFPLDEMWLAQSKGLYAGIDVAGPIAVTITGYYV